MRNKKIRRGSATGARRWKEREPAEEREEAIAVSIAPRHFDIEQFLSNTGERNYCLTLFLREEKGKLIAYLNEKGAREDQIATILQKLQKIVDS